MRCGLPLPTHQSPEVCGACLVNASALGRTVAAVDYSFPWDRILGDFKFKAHLGLRDALVDLLCQALIKAGSPQADWVLPVPLHPERLRERGYNQSWAIAQGIAQRRQCRPDAELLLRIRATPHQVGLSQGERRRNLRHAFLVPPTRVAQVQGQHVALVDDVMTTGSTLQEAAATLLAAGARSVQAWVIARTPAPSPPQLSPHSPEQDQDKRSSCSTSSSCTPRSPPTPEM